MSKKILFIVNSLSGGGAEKVCLNMAEELYKLGFQCDFITLYEDEKKYEYDFININLCLNINRESSFFARILAILKKRSMINDFVSKSSYSLITAHLYMSHVLASLIKTSKKTLYVMHNAQWPLDLNNSYMYFKKINLFYENKKIITVSKGIELELINKYKINKKNIFTIYNPVPIDNILIRAEDKINIDYKYIISMGRLSYPKRPDIALDLFYKSGIYKEYKLIFLGKGEMKNSLDSYVSENNLDDRVIFKGYVENPYPWIKNAKLMLSMSDSEAMPMNIIESLACDTGVVAIDCKYGPDEILVDELSEFLIRDREDLKNNVRILKNAIESYPKIDFKVLEKFESGKIVDKYLTYYKNNFL